MDADGSATLCRTTERGVMVAATTLKVHVSSTEELDTEEIDRIAQAVSAAIADAGLGDWGVTAIEWQQAESRGAVLMGPGGGVATKKGGRREEVDR